MEHFHPRRGISIFGKVQIFKVSSKLVEGTYVTEKAGFKIKSNSTNFSSQKFKNPIKKSGGRR